MVVFLKKIGQKAIDGLVIVAFIAFCASPFLALGAQIWQWTTGQDLGFLDHE